MPINVSEALDYDTSEVITVKRQKGGFVDGLYIKGKTNIFKALASVQQPTPKQILTLPEGERDKNVFLFISNKPLQTADDREGTIADVVMYKGKNYKLIRAGDWTAYGHTMAFGARD